MGFIYGLKSHFWGNLPKTYFLASWLSDESAYCPNDMDPSTLCRICDFAADYELGEMDNGSSWKGGLF